MQATPPYQIIKTIYEGNEGPVYLIKDSKKRKYVMKKYQYEPSKYGLDPSLLIELMCLKQFKGEKHLLELDHIEYRRGEVNIIVEKMDDQISELILDRPNLAKIRNYLKQILKGLAVLHSHGIFHNDLKPMNIMYKKISKETRIKIIDFGLAHLINFPYHRARMIQTTHHYTPPEYRDHREIGRVSVNSDMFSLGIIFYYFLNPTDYERLDDDPHHDNIFDPHHVDWKVVTRKAGKNGANLLRQMLEYHPEKRITSQQALEHPFFDGEEKLSQKGEGRRRRRRWEEPHLMSRDEYLNPSNQTEFLDEIVIKSTKSKIKVNPRQRIPNYVWNMLYEYFDELRIKFITLNYAFFLINFYLTKKKIRPDHWEYLALGCLFLSMKLNEFGMSSSVNIFNIENSQLVLKYEEEVGKTLNFAFPIPILVTKEVIMYRHYLDIIYRKSKEAQLNIVGNVYNQYYILNLLSSLLYISPELSNKNKLELVKVILSFPYPVEHSKTLRRQIIEFVKNRRQISWINDDFLEFVGIRLRNRTTSRRRG